LCLAALGRAGLQITLSELADAVGSDANRITGLGFDPDSGADRRALVDAVGWLEERGVVRLTDGSSASWVGDPRAGEALYDIARDVVFALFRPPRVLQQIDSVRALLDRPMSRGGNAERRAAAQAARRAVIELPVVYYADVRANVANHLRGAALPGDLHRLTGLRVERRADGVALIDTARLSVEQFPGTGSVAQAAVLLAVEMSDRIVDPDGRRVRWMAQPDPGGWQRELIRRIDVGLPIGRISLTDESESATPIEDAEPDDTRYPFLTDSFLREAVTGILSRYGSAFGAAWNADPDQLRSEAIAMLQRFGMVIPVPGGVLVRPVAGRYRNTVAQVRQRALF
jgi:hypothetical protein